MQHLNEGLIGSHSAAEIDTRLANTDFKPPEDDLDKLNSLLSAIAALDGRMRAIAGRDGTYRAGSSGMADVFKLGTCLYLDDGIIRVSQAEYTDGLQQLLNVRGAEVRTLALPCWRTNGHLLVRATANCDETVIMSLQRATEMVEPELADLQQVFHLTRTEASIVYDLFLGCTPQKIAQVHQNSIHTIRAHIRRCYDKLGITCREELWRKLNAYRVA